MPRSWWPAGAVAGPVPRASRCCAAHGETNWTVGSSNRPMIPPFVLPLILLGSRVAQAAPVPLSGTVHRQAQRQYDRGPVSPAQQLGYITVMLKRSPEQQAALERLLEQQQDRASPLYHRWLTP